MSKFTADEQTKAALSGAWDAMVTIFKHTHQCADCQILLSKLLRHADPENKLEEKYKKYIYDDMKNRGNPQQGAE
jgi:hypothetical protein